MTTTIDNLPQPKIDEATYKELMDKSRIEFPTAPDWILHVAVTDYLFKKKKGYRKDIKLINELKDNYFKDTVYHGLEILTETEKNISNE
eukprot:768721-Hanusia_phi.AAC.3